MKDITKYTTNILDDINKRFYDIPFENSMYQTKTFVIAAQLTPARAYRAIGLRMFSKINALKEAKTKMQLDEIDREENEYLMGLTETSSFEKRRLKIKNTQIESAKDFSNKLINDAITELDILYKELQKYPRYDREQFEIEEEVHFQLSMEHQLKSNNSGPIESLQNMQSDAPKLDNMLNDKNYVKMLIDTTREDMALIHEGVE